MKPYFRRLPLLLIAAAPAAAARVAPVTLSAPAVRAASVPSFAVQAQMLDGFPGYQIPYIPPAGKPAPEVPPYLPLDGRPAKYLPGLRRVGRFHAEAAVPEAPKPAPLSESELREIFDGEDRRPVRGWDRTSRPANSPIGYPEYELERDLGLFR